MEGKYFTWGVTLLSVMLVDDDPTIREDLMQMAQRSREISILPVHSAADALKILEEQSFDAIITDYAMAGMDGLAFIRAIRSKSNMTPVILFTREQSDAIAVEALNSGTDYYLRKGKDPRMQFRELTDIMKKICSQSVANHSRTIAFRIIRDLVNFSSDPSYAISRDGIVIAWNDTMEQLSDIPAKVMLGKGDYAYAEPFHGCRKKILADLIFAPDDEIKKEQYMIISRINNGPLIAVTRGVSKDGSGRTLWSKVIPIFDMSGRFLAAVGTVRDVTATFGDIIPREPVPDEGPAIPVKIPHARKPANKLLTKLLNSAISHYKEGVILYIKIKDYRGAIAAFDRAIEIDNTLPYVWNDRGICYRELGDYTHALKSCLRAVELAPESPQCLFTLGETLAQIGMMYNSAKYFDSAIQTFKMVANQLPNHADTWNHIGICYREMGNPDEAKFYLDRARDIRLGGKNVPIRYTHDEYL